MTACRKRTYFGCCVSVVGIGVGGLVVMLAVVVVRVMVVFVVGVIAMGMVMKTVVTMKESVKVVFQRS